MKYILFFLISITTIYSQSIVVTEIDTESYPDVELEFFLIDDTGKNIVYDINKISLEENGTPRSLDFFGCNQEYTKEPISLVLTIDVSSSMNDTVTQPSTKRIEVVKKAAKKVINTFHPDTEIAFTIFSSEPTLLHNLTTDRSLTENAIDNLDIPLGSTVISKAFLDKDEGVIAAFENAKYQKVSLFMTDGNDGALKKDSLAKALNENDITLYCISADISLEQELIDVALQTGGRIYSGAQSEKEIINSFSAIANYINNIPPCTAIYTSEICDLNRYIEINYENKYAGSKSFSMIKNQLIEYSIINNSQKKYGSNKNLYYVTIKSNSDDLVITDITSNYMSFNLIDPMPSSLPITLNQNETLNLTFTNSVENISIYDFFNIESSSCFDDKIYLKYSNDAKSLNVITPNGGEEFYVGTNENILWNDTDTSNHYDISYSTNSGANWLSIANNYNDKDFPWESVPKPDTDKALLKVSKNINLDSRIKTTSVETLDKPYSSRFDDIIPYMDDKFLAISDMYLNFKFSNLELTNSDLDVSTEFDFNYVKILMILDKNLDVLNYVPISTNAWYLNLATVGDTPYLSLNNTDYVIVDTLEHKQNGGESDYGVILKFDDKLNFIKHSLYRVKDNFNGFGDFIIDFKSSSNRLHLLGLTKKYYEHNDSLIVSLFGSSDVYFLTSLDLDLNLLDIELYNVDEDNFDFVPKGIEANNDDLVTWWGNGTGKYFGLDSNKRAMTLISSYDNNNIVLNNFLSVEPGGNVFLADYEQYRDQEYLLFSSDEVLETKTGTKIPIAVDNNVRLINIDSEGEIGWLVNFDNYGINNKLISLVNYEDILVTGRMNKAVRIDDKIVAERGNTTFFTGIDLLSGKLSWYRYARTANTFITATSNSNTIVYSGKLNDETDFGSGFVRGNSTVDTLNNNFLWVLEVNTEPEYDISDSLWSIKLPGFEYIDTVNFGNVYPGSIKDTIVLDFFELTDNSINITIESINIEDAGYSVDFNTPHKLIENTDLKIILDVDLAGGGLSKGIISTNIGDFNFYVLSNEVELRYRPYYENDSVAIDFGEVLVGEQKSETIYILENLGLANIGLDSVRLTNDNGNNYSFNIITDETLLLSGDTLITEFTFSPNFVGTQNATAQFFTDIYRDPFYIRITGKGISNDTISINIRIDSMMYDSGKYIDLNTFITINDNPSSLQFDSLEVDIQYNSTLLIPFRLSDDGIVENKIRKITLPISQAEIQKGIDVKRFYSTIGNSISTDIEITDVRAYNTNGDFINELKYTTENGYFELINVCYTDGSYRLYNESDPTDLNIYYENGEYFVNYNLIEDGFTNISIFDTNGKLVSHLVNKNVNKGAYTTEVDTRNIANGSYIVQLETENVVLSKILVIVE